jgi:acyl carrier protein
VLHERPNLPTPYTAPATDLEKTIADVWQTVLGFEKIGTQDNLFELGGDSLIAIRVIARLKDALKVDLSAAQLYQGLTIESLAKIIEGEQESSEAKAEKFEARKDKMTRRKELQQQRRRGKN